MYYVLTAVLFEFSFVILRKLMTSTQFIILGILELSNKMDSNISATDSQ